MPTQKALNYSQISKKKFAVRKIVVTMTLQRCLLSIQFILFDLPLLLPTVNIQKEKKTLDKGNATFGFLIFEEKQLL
jgi:hypothetical protein